MLVHKDGTLKLVHYGFDSLKFHNEQLKMKSNSRIYSPESFKNQKGVQTDKMEIFSLGVALYDMLHGIDTRTSYKTGFKMN